MATKTSTTSTSIYGNNPPPAQMTQAQATAAIKANPAWNTPATPAPTATPAETKPDTSPTGLAKTAQQNLAATAKPQTADEIYQQKSQQSAGMMSSISDLFNKMVSGQQDLGKTNIQQANAEAAARGLTGSAEGYAKVSGAMGENKKAVDLIEAQRNVQIQSILGDIQTRSDAELARQQELYSGAQKDVIGAAAIMAGTEATEAGTQATLAGIKQTEANIESQKISDETKRIQNEGLVEANKKAYKDNFDQLAQVARTSWQDYQKANPQGAADLLAKTGMNETDAAFRWNASKKATEQIQWEKTPQQTANGYLFTGLDPITGKVVTQEVKVPIGGEWSFSPANMYQDSMMVNKNTGEVKTYQSYINSIPGNTNSVCADGTVGGECGDFVHTVVDNIPAMGDTIGSKMEAINKNGVLTANWKPKVGDVIVQKYGTTGHAAVVTGVNGDKLTIKQSNKGLDGKVTSETISAKDPSIYGAFDKGNMKSKVADGSMSPRELALQQKLASLKRTEQMTASGDVMMASRRTTVINNTIKSLYGSATANPVATYNKSAQVMARVNAAKERALDPTNKAKNVADLDLIDAYVQIARGGQAITEAQVETLMSGMGIPAKFDVAAQKIVGSATLDDPTRKELANLSQKIYEEQGKAAKNAIPQLNQSLKAAGIPDSMLLQSPKDIVGMEFEKPVVDETTFKQLQSQLQADEVLATDSEGNIVAATQQDINSGAYTPYQQ